MSMVNTNEKAEEAKVEVGRHGVTLPAAGTHVEVLGSFPEREMLSAIYCFWDF